MPCQQLNATLPPEGGPLRLGVARQLHAREDVQEIGAIMAISALDAAFQPFVALSRAHSERI